MKICKYDIEGEMKIEKIKERDYSSQVWIELKDKVNIEKEARKKLTDEMYLKKKYN